MNRLAPVTILLSLATTLPWAGCQPTDDWVPRQESDPEVEEIARKLEARAESLAIKDTIGSLAWLQGMQPMRVRGYGIVVGLGEAGSRECPPEIRNSLIQEMRRRHHLGSRTRGLKELSPSDLLSDLDTAVVVVTAEIAGAATRGTSMDVRVSALPGAQTKSLEGGYLWRCDLKRFRTAGPTAVIQGKTLAYAEGPVFVNPFDEEGLPLEEATPREGVVLGGGTVIVDRGVRLELREPSFQMAMATARQINNHYGHDVKVADATSPGTIELHIPRAYCGREDYFLSLVTHLLPREPPQSAETRMRALADELLNPDAPHDDIGLAWETFGQRALPVIRRLYSDHRPYVNFYAARTGIRLDDEAALLVLRRHAHDLQSPHQQEAIRELASAVNFTEAADALRPLLSHENERVRIMSYQALRERGDRYIRPLRVGAPNFTIDRVRSKEPALIYACTGQAQRLAVFGEPACRAPVFYEHRDRLYGLHAGKNSETITVMRRNAEGQLVAEPVEAPLEVVGLAATMGREIREGPDGTAPGLNLAYSHVVKALYDLAETGTIRTAFHVETIQDRRWLGPLEPPGRPETDLED
ncbi:MAG: flagellar basal body P-ring protein FlgI [Phycisphaerales bacterium]|nr:MAG: flagellar basal body P-ring protein FlgI [Phycisphaerales bacterium]